MTVKLMNEEQVRGATKAELAEALTTAGITFKVKGRKDVMVELLLAAVANFKAKGEKPKRKPSIQARLFNIFDKVGTTLPEAELKKHFPDVSSPPWTFTLSGSMSSARMSARACTANASFSSIRP